MGESERGVAKRVAAAAGRRPETGLITHLSVFFPCYNDATTIGELVTRAAGTLDVLGLDGDIVVVNDGSRDDSAAVLATTASAERRLHVVTHERNRGYGAALQSGFAAAHGDWVFYTDGDGQYDPQELAELVQLASDDVDVVQGYKLGRSDNLARRVIGRLYHHVVAFLFGLRIRDTDCDFRLIRRRVLDRIELTETSGVICVELVRKLRDAGARFVEVGVHHYPRTSGRSTFFRPANVARTLRDLARLWISLVVRRSDAREETTTTVPAHADRAVRTSSWRDVIAPFFVSRAIADALLVAVGMLRAPGALLSGFTSWDGRWYRAIALHGYVVPPHVPAHETPWPFFPLLPGALRMVTSVGIPVTWAGIACNHVAFLVALVGIHRLAVRHTSRSAANLAVWLAALGPLAFVFSMLYPSALFLAASVWAFVWVEERRDVAAGLAAAVAALTRPNGIVLVIALLIAVGFAARRVVRIALPVVAAIAGWVWFNALRTGDPLRFLTAKRAWREVTLIGFVLRPTGNAVVHVAVAALAVGVVMVARKRIPASWTWFSVLYLVPSLALGMVGLARYATDLFPPYIAGASILERRPATSTRTVLAVFVVAQACFAFYFIDGRHVV